MKFVLFFALAIASVTAKIYFQETFGDDYSKRWVTSNWKQSSGEAGKLEHSAGPFYGDAEEDKGLRTSQDAKFYASSAKFEQFSSKDATTVIQFQVRFPQQIDCGGGYIKVMPDVNQKEFNGDSQYNIMFGPDICGSSTKKVHVIFAHNGKNHLIKKEIRALDDKFSHVYTLVVKPDDTFEVYIDGEKKESGSLADNWDFMAPRQIKDPKSIKPSDWVDSAKMDDPTDQKPEGYDSVQKEIPDPDAKKPEDWDTEADGEWEAPTIPNPEFKGEWKPRQIDNPAYKGPWVQAEIANPDFVEYKDLHAYPAFGAVGIDVWQVKAGTVFDNIFIGNDLEEAIAFRKETFEKNKAAEKKMHDDQDKVRREKEEADRKKAEEEKKSQEADKEDDDEEEHVEDKISEKAKGHEEL